jgi:hypothetical protein
MSELINNVPLRGRGSLPRVRSHGAVFLFWPEKKSCKFGLGVRSNGSHFRCSAALPTFGHTTGVLVFAGMK